MDSLFKYYVNVSVFVFSIIVLIVLIYFLINLNRWFRIFIVNVFPKKIAIEIIDTYTFFGSMWLIFTKRNDRRWIYMANEFYSGDRYKSLFVKLFYLPWITRIYNAMQPFSDQETEAYDNGDEYPPSNDKVEYELVKVEYDDTDLDDECDVCKKTIEQCKCDEELED